jgi:hypothetical protein
MGNVLNELNAILEDMTDVVNIGICEHSGNEIKY